MAQGPIISYNAYIISPGLNLQINGVGTPNLTATYDDWPTDASGVAAHCMLSISYTNIQWTIADDNSITVTGNITGGTLVRSGTGASSSQQQLVTAKFNNNEVFSQTVNTASSGTYNLNLPATFSVTIPPSNNPQPAYPAAIEFKNDNTTSQNPPDQFYLGIIITNPNPPDYRPGATINSSSVWLSHNRGVGKAHVLSSALRWGQMRTLNGLVDSGNPPSIRHNNKWMNQRKLGKES